MIPCADLMEHKGHGRPVRTSCHYYHSVQSSPETRRTQSGTLLYLILDLLSLLDNLPVTRIPPLLSTVIGEETKSSRQRKTLNGRSSCLATTNFILPCMEQVYSTEHLLRDFFGVFLKTGSHVPKTPRSVKYRSKTPRSQYYLPKSKYRISFERFAQNIASTCLFGGNKTSIPCSCKQNAWVLHTVSTCGLDLCTWKNQISNSKLDTSHTTRQRLHYLRCHLPPPVPRIAKHEPDKGKRLKTEYRISFQSPQAACNLTPLRFCWSAVRKGVALCMIALAAWGFRSVSSFVPVSPQTAPEGQ